MMITLKTKIPKLQEWRTLTIPTIAQTMTTTLLLIIATTTQKSIKSTTQAIKSTSTMPRQSQECGTIIEVKT